MKARYSQYTTIHSINVNGVAYLCNVLRIMHRLSLAILSRLSRYHPSAVRTN